MQLFRVDSPFAIDLAFAMFVVVLTVIAFVNAEVMATRGTMLRGANANEEQVLTARLFVRRGDSLLSNITHVGDNTVNFDLLAMALGNGRAVVTWTQKLVPTNGAFGNNVAAAILEVVRQNQDFVRVLPGATRVNTSDPAGLNSIRTAELNDEQERERIAFA
jgi:hypothetical protein